MTTQIGLSTANFLLLAKGHLVKARGVEASNAGPTYNPMVWAHIVRAIEHVREARKLLKEEEEDPCTP